MATLPMNGAAKARRVAARLLAALVALIAIPATATTQLLLPQYVTIPGAADPNVAGIFTGAKPTPQNPLWYHPASTLSAPPNHYVMKGANPIFEGAVARNLRTSQQLISGLSAAEAATLAEGITGTAAVNQSLAKSIAAKALRLTPLAIGAGLTAWALSEGLEYLNGQWYKGSPTQWKVIQGVNYLLLGECSGWWGTAQCIYSPGVIDPPVGYIAVQCQGVHNGGTSGCPIPGGGGYTTASVFVVSAAMVADPTTVHNPATDVDFDTAASEATDLTDEQLAEMLAAGFGVPVGAISPAISAAAARIKAGLPYQDPISGNTLQPYVDLSPSGEMIRATTSDQVIDPLTGEPILEGGQPIVTPGQPVVTETPESSSVILGGLDGMDPAPGTSSLAFTPGTLGETGACPAPSSATVAGISLVFDWQPVCTAASTYVRPLVLIAASIAAYLIFVGGLRT